MNMNNILLSFTVVCTDQLFVIYRPTYTSNSLKLLLHCSEQKTADQCLAAYCSSGLLPIIASGKDRIVVKNSHLKAQTDYFSLSYVLNLS